METVFERAFAIIIGEEGGYSNNPNDPGNWTGGRCGAGICAGTKFGISAAAYPGLVVFDLTLEDARTIYRREYWDKIRADVLPPPLALLVFDAAVNNGVGRAIRWLQQAAGTTADGSIGPKTLQSLAAADGAALMAEFQALRLVFMAGLPTWPTFASGWARRLCRLPYHAILIGAK